MGSTGRNTTNVTYSIEIQSPTGTLMRMNGYTQGSVREMIRDRRLRQESDEEGISIFVNRKGTRRYIFKPE